MIGSLTTFKIDGLLRTTADEATALYFEGLSKIMYFVVLEITWVM